ncbi:MAG: V-type ATP synthase subunit E [Clostridia bacterium]|nr:V-type ATP synthase subunit E [Clostridia bacterium]
MQTKDTMEKKLAQFGAVVMADAANERDAIIASFQKRKDAILCEYEKRAKEEGKAARKHAEEEARTKAGVLISETTFECKRALWKTREKLTNELFESVREKIEEYMKTPEYETYLLYALREAQKIGSDIVAYLSPKDNAQYAQTMLRNGAALVSSENIFGGVRFVIRDKRISLDMTFDTRLGNERESFNKFL